MSVRAFLRFGGAGGSAGHSTISRTRRLFPVETHQAVFIWVLEQLAEAGLVGLVAGKTLGVDATTLEANAAMRSIVRRDTGGDYTAFLTRLATASGIETPTKKKTSNKDLDAPPRPGREGREDEGRQHPPGPQGGACGGSGDGCGGGCDDSGGRTRGYDDDGRDPRDPRDGDGAGGGGVAGGGAGCGGGCGQGLPQQRDDGGSGGGVRSYIAKPDRGRRSWKHAPEARDAVYGNRRRVRGKRGRRLLRRRGELVERPFAHLFETGGMRRVHLRTF